jgi:uncharacterized protein
MVAPSPLLLIPAQDIDTGGRVVDEALPIEWLQRELGDAHATVDEPGRVQIRLSRSGKEDIVVRGRVQARFAVPSGRSGRPAPLDVDAEVTLLLSPSPEAASLARGRRGPKKVAGEPSYGGERASGDERKGKRRGRPEAADHAGRGAKPKSYEFAPGEADLDVYDGKDVVLDPFVREALLLEIPIFPLAPDEFPLSPDEVTAKDPTPSSPEDLEASEPDEPLVDPRLQPLAAIRDRLAQSGGGGQKKH